VAVTEPSAFFLPLDAGAYRATAATQGPWDPRAMHGGPVAALLATLLTGEIRQSSATQRLARLSVDFLGPLTLGDLAVAVRILRPGRRVALAEAALDDGGRAVAVARGWFIDAAAAGGERPIDAVREPPAAGEVPALPMPPPLPGPSPQRFFAGGDSFGYGAANEWRFTSGGFDSLGPAGVWCRTRLPLIEGQPLTGIQRLLILADAANGISGELAWGHWLFIPPGITVSFLREPAGEWIHLAARTTLGVDGVGLTHGRLADAGGPVAIVSQPLLVSRTTTA
jgi:hypothetical protein